jgi:hypothetical protein
MITPQAVSITDLLFMAASRSAAFSFNTVMRTASRSALPATPAKVNALSTARDEKESGIGAKKFSTAEALF